MPPINDWVNVAAVRSELPVIRPESKAKGRDHFLLADFPLLIRPNFLEARMENLKPVLGRNWHLSDKPTNRDLEKCTIWDLCYTPRT